MNRAGGVERPTCLGRVTIPPVGARGRISQEGHESAYCMLGGEDVELFTSDRIENREIVRPGDYWFIPAKGPRLAISDSSG